MECGEPKNIEIGPLVRAAIDLGGEVVTIDDKVPTKEEQTEIDKIKEQREIPQGNEAIEQ